MPTWLSRSVSLLFVASLLAGCVKLAPAPTQPAEPVPSRTAAAPRLSEATTPPAPTRTATPGAAPEDPAGSALLPALSEAALRPAFAADAHLPGLPQYDMNLYVDVAAHSLRGSALITYTNTTGTPLRDIVLRLYPNMPHGLLEGELTQKLRMQLQDVQIAGQPVEPLLEAEATAARIPLPSPLAPGAQLALQVDFQASFSPWQEGEDVFLLSYYPMLAVHEPAGWRQDVVSFPDIVYAQTALYRVRVRLSSDWELAASGVEVHTAHLSDGTSIHEFLSGPVREWALTLGQLEVSSSSYEDVTINVYQQAGLGLDTQRIARIASASLRSFEQRFGPYPYRELDLHLWRGQGDGGIEYPGLVIILVGGTVGSRTDFVVAHEVAHQYWYAVVGNDIFQEAWLDESLAQYSAIIAIEDHAGLETAETLYNREVGRLLDSCAQRNNPPVDIQVTATSDFSDYHCAVYGRGAAFMRELRSELGDAVFNAGMRAFYGDNRYGIVQREDFQRAMEQAAGRSLGDIFSRWLEP